MTDDNGAALLAVLERIAAALERIDARQSGRVLESLTKDQKRDVAREWGQVRYPKTGDPRPPQG